MGLWEWVIEYDDHVGFTYCIHRECNDGFVVDLNTVEQIVNRIAEHVCN